MNSFKINSLIANDEGFCPKLYKDTKGFNTIGYGFNLDTTLIPKEVADHWLSLNIEKLSRDLSSYIPFFSTLDTSRQYVLLNMAYQMGIAGILKFKKMLIALENNDYILASKEMKNSKWYVEFTNRANRLVNIMNSGEF
jgi:lysozyme